MKNLKRFPIASLAFMLLVGMGLSVQPVEAAKQLVVGTATVGNTGDEASRTRDLAITLKGGFNDVNGLAFTLAYDKDIFDFLGLFPNTVPMDDGSTYDPQNPPSAATVAGTLYYQINHKAAEGRVLIAAAGANFFTNDPSSDVVPFKARFRVKPGMGNGPTPIFVQRTIIGPGTAASAGYTVPTPIPVATGLDPQADSSTAQSFPVELVAGSINVIGGYTISGTVQYSGGTNADGAVVYLKKKVGNEYVPAGEKVVSGGLFNFSNRSNGEYKIVIISMRPGYQSRYESNPITVNNAGVDLGIITLAAYSPITGTVTVNGSPVPGVKVKVMQGATLIGYFPVDASGNFVTSPLPLPAGSYTFTAVYGSAESTSFDPTTAPLDWTLSLGTLSGTISGLASGQNMMVHIASATAKLEKVRYLTGDGNDLPYDFANLLPATDYIVSVVGDGIPVTYYNGVTDISDATPQTVTAGVDTSNVDFSISGTVVAISGQITKAGLGVKDVPVFAETTLLSPALYVALSDSNGDYTLNVADGTYIVYAYNNGKLFYYNTAATTQVDTEASQITPPLAGADIELDEFSCMIKGKVSYRILGGDPVEDIMVLAEGPKGGSVDVTDDKGNYMLSGLFCGDLHEVTIFPYDPYPPQTGSASATTDGTILNFIIHTGWVLSGNVTEEGTSTDIQGAWVYLEDSSGFVQGMPSITKSDGQFTLADIETGVYTLVAAHRNYQTVQEPNLTIDTDISGHTVTMVPGVTISGVVDDGTNPLSGVLITATSVGEESRYVITNAQGAYAVNGLTSGRTYFLVFNKKGFVKQVLSTTAPQTGFDVTMIAPASLVDFNGTVQLSGGTPLDGAIVVVQSISKNFFKATTTTGGGGFSFTNLVASDDYLVIVIPPGNKPLHIESVVLTGTVTGYTITIPVGTITGTVTLSDSATGADVSVYLIDSTDGDYVTDVTAQDNGDGTYTYTFDNVKAGTDFKVVAFSAGYGLGWYGGADFSNATNVQADATAVDITLTTP